MPPCLKKRNSDTTVSALPRNRTIIKIHTSALYVKHKAASLSLALLLHCGFGHNESILQLDFLALWWESSGQLEEICSIIFCFFLCINFPPVKPKIPPPSAAAIPATLKPARRPIGPPTTPPMTAPATGRAASLYFAACKGKKKN